MRYQPAVFRAEPPKGGYTRFAFGTFPVRDEEWEPRIKAVRNLLDCLDGRTEPTTDAWFTDSISIAKGLFTRIALGDQNDWFTVSRQLGHPSAAFSKRVSSALKGLRKAVIAGNEDGVRRAMDRLKEEPVSECLSHYLETCERGRAPIREEGWAYILWSSTERDIVHAGAAGGTIDDVEKRLRREYPGNPYGVMAAWLVEDAVEAHDLVRKTFDRQALGDGFFRVDIGEAKRTLDAALTAEGLAVDSPWHEDPAGPKDVGAFRGPVAALA